MKLKVLQGAYCITLKKIIATFGNTLQLVKHITILCQTQIKHSINSTHNDSSMYVCTQVQTLLPTQKGMVLSEAESTT